MDLFGFQFEKNGGVDFFGRCLECGAHLTSTAGCHPCQYRRMGVTIVGNGLLLDSTQEPVDFISWPYDRLIR